MVFYIWLCCGAWCCGVLQCFYRVVLCRVVLCGVALGRIIFRFVLRCVVLCFIELYHVMLCFVVSYGGVVLSRASSCCVVSSFVSSRVRHVLLCWCGVLFRVVSCWLVPCCMLLHRVGLRCDGL